MTSVSISKSFIHKKVHLVVIFSLVALVSIQAQPKTKDKAKSPPTFNNAVLVPEEIKSKCANTAIENRIKVRVARFSRSTSGTDGVDINNFSSMFSNALFEVDCYRVLAMQKDTTDSGSDVDTDLEKPQIVATGEIIEYNHTTNTTNVSITKKTRYVAKLGFVLQIKNAATQEILFSRSFNKEGLAESNAVNMTIKVPGLGNQNVGSTSDEPIQKAYFDAIEKGIIDAVTFLIENQTRISELLKGVSGSDNKTNLIINNITFTKLLEVEQSVKAIAGVQKVEKTLTGGVGKMIVIHSGTMDELVSAIAEKLKTLIEVTGMEGNKITLQGK